MSSTMIDDLATRGHIMGVHTYDHPLASDIKQGQWDKELKAPKIFLENVIHNDANYFAYPYGFWTDNYVDQLKKDEYKAAFQLDGRQNLKSFLIQ